MSRDEFDGLLEAMVRAGLISIEDAEYEKDGEVRRFRKVRLTEAALEARATTHAELLISDGVVEEFGGRRDQENRKKNAGRQGRRIHLERTASTGSSEFAKERATQIDTGNLSAQAASLASQLKEWRAAEAKKLRVPAYCVLHDRTLYAVAHVRPENPRQLLEIDGIGPAKVEKFGAAILEVCGTSS